MINIRTSLKLFYRSLLAQISLCFCLATVSLSVYPQPGLTPDLIERINQLSPEERAAILNQSQQSPGSVEAPVSTPVTTAPRTAEPSANERAIEENAAQSQSSDETIEDVEARGGTRTPLRQFGYDLFAGTPSTFAPATNIPVPQNYVIGPGDTVILQLYGQRNQRYEIAITREGVLQFPEVGPLNVAGLTFDEMVQLIQNTVQTSLIGQQVTVTMGALRSIQIFVLGEIFRPGSYTVSSLSTMTNALFSSGGVTNVGSLRNVRLMRSGELVTELDLYDLLLRGDTSGDVRLLPNDVIFIPPIGRTVGIGGEVIRPAIFELKDEETVEDVLPLAGGVLPTAFPSASRIERINQLGERTLVDIDLSNQDDIDTQMRDGDVIQIYSILDQVEGIVTLEGHVNRPGGFAWRQGLRVTDIIPSIGDMLPNPDLDYALISREVQPERTLEIINVELGKALADPGSEADLELQARDRLLVFGRRQSRQQQVQELIEILRSQSSFDRLPMVVNIQGNVLFPGAYPLINNMTVDDLVKFAGGLDESTELNFAIIERQIDLKGTIDVSTFSFDPTTLATKQSIALKPLDRLVIFNTNGSRADLLADTIGKLRQQANTENPTRIVSVIGNVRFPGNYPLYNDLNVDNLIEIAGGFTESAEITQAEITRYDAEPVIGREVGHTTIDLTSNSPVNGSTFKLQPFDQLIIRQMPNWTEVESVTIGGEVNSPGTYVITKDETMTSLIRRAGGLTEFADTRGAVFLRESLRITEGQLLEEYRTQLENDIITLRLQQQVLPGGSTDGQSEAIQLLDRIRSVEPVGRLVINLPQILANLEDDVILRDSDQLLIPRYQQEITVTGEVFRPTSHLYNRNLSYSAYISKSGGLTDDADKSNIYALKVNGEIVQLGRGRWFFESRNPVEPGDTIVVPFDAYKPYGFYVWTNVAQIVSSLSTTLLLIDRIVND